MVQLVKSNSWFWLRSWSQGPGASPPHQALCSARESACRVSPLLPLPLPLLEYSLSNKQVNKTFFLKKASTNFHQTSQIIFFKSPWLYSTLLSEIIPLLEMNWLNTLITSTKYLHKDTYSSVWITTDYSQDKLIPTANHSAKDGAFYFAKIVNGLFQLCKVGHLVLGWNESHWEEKA